MKKILVLILVFLVVGIGGWWIFNQKYQTVKDFGSVEKVQLRLKWLDQAQFAGNYVAMEKGYYKDYGLEVSFVPFSFEETAIDAVLSGKAEFGIAGADEMLVARSKGKPVKAIAVIYKINPGAFYVMSDSGIKRPQDFVGKRIGVQRGANTEYLYLAMMNKLGIDRDKVTEVPVGFDYQELFDDKVDASIGYAINKPTQVISSGKEVSTIMMADYGVNMYADVLFTTDEMIKTKPGVVESMVRGTLDGWREVIEQTDEALDMTMKYAPESSRDLQSYMLNVSIPLIYTAKQRLGWMEGIEWEKAYDILFENRVISENMTVGDVFTMQFLEAIYK